MKKLITSLVALVSFGTVASGEIDTPAFKLKLGGDWRQEKTSGSEQFSYYSKSLNVWLTTSFILMKVRSSDTERIANRLKELRLEGEAKAAKAFNLKMTIVEPIIIPFSEGYQVAYYGHDNNNRQFRYLGIVLPSKITNIYAESKTKSQQELEDIFNLLLKGLSI